MYEAQEPRNPQDANPQMRLPFQLDAPPYDYLTPTVPLIPARMGPRPTMPPIIPPQQMRPPDNLAGLSPLQAGSVTGQPNYSAALAAVLARIFGQG